MVKNPSRFSGATGLRQNIQRAAAPKIQNYADSSVQPSQAFYEADASVPPNTTIPPNDIISDDSLMSVAPDDRPDWDKRLDERDEKTVIIQDNQKRGGLYGWHQDNKDKEDKYQGVEGFHWLANVFQQDPDKKFIVNPNKEDGAEKFITTGAYAVQQANLATAAEESAAAEDKILADQKAVLNEKHHGNYDTFYIGGEKVNPNQVKFDEMRNKILKEDKYALGTSQKVDGVSVFTPWAGLTSDYGPNVTVNYGLTGNPMNPSPATGPSGTMKISRSMSEQSHAGIQTSLNKQQMNRDFNSTLKTWRTDYLLGPRDQASKEKAKAFIDAQKAKYLGYEDRGGHGFGGYGELFGKELDKRYYNLFDSPNAPGQNIPSNKKLTLAEKLRIKIDNGTATQADIKKYGVLTKAPGNVTGYDSLTGVKANDSIVGYQSFMGNNNLY